MTSGGSEQRLLEIKALFNDAATAAFKRMEQQATKSAGSVGKAFADAAKNVSKFVSNALSTAAGVALERAFEGALHLAREFAGMVVDSAEKLSHLGRVADELGTSTEALGALVEKAEQLGLSIDDVATAQKHFQVAVGEAAEGSKQQAIALDKLGLSARDFADGQIDVIDALARVADGMHGVQSQAERTRILVELFGREGQRLAPLLKEGGDAVRRLAEEARSAGTVFSRDEIQKVQDMQAAWVRLQQTIEAFAARLLIEVAPLVQHLLDGMVETLHKHAPEIRDALFDVADALVSFAEIATKVVEKVHDLFESLTSRFNTTVLGWKVILAELTRINFEIFGGSPAATQKAQEHAAELQSQLRVMEQAVNDYGKAVEFTTKEQDEFFAKIHAGIAASRAALQRQTGEGVPLGPPAPESKTDGLKKGAEQADRAFDNLSEGITHASVAWTDWNKAAFDAGEALVNGPLTAFQDNLAAVISHTKSAKQAFHDFGQATIQVLAQVIARLITVRILSAIFGAGNVNIQGPTGGSVLRAKGGVDPGGVESLMPIRRMAMGGVVRGPHLAILGEGSAPAEAFVPLPDGRRIQVDMRNFRGGGGGDTHVYIQAWDGQDVVRVLSKHRGLLRAFAQQDLQERNAVRQGVQQVRR